MPTVITKSNPLQGAPVQAPVVPQDDRVPVRLRLSPAAYEMLTGHHDSFPRFYPNGMDGIVERLLQDYGRIAPDERVLVIREADRQELEKIFQVPQLTGIPLLLEKIKALASVTIGDLTFHPTTAQISALKRRAAANGKDVKVELEKALREAYYSVFGWTK